jgi:hypothetical protein
MSPDSAFSARLARRRQGLIPDEPPAEVLEAIAVAAQRYDDLQVAGHEIHLGIGAFTRRLSAELRGDDGQLIESLTPRRVLELACGPLPF